jgi:hypothetical protein
MKGFMYYVAYLVCFFLIRFPRKVKVEGRENIPKDQNFIIVANHISLWDPWVIGSFISITTPVHWFTIERLYDPIKVRQYLPKRLREGLLGSILARVVTFTMRHTYTIKVAAQSYEDMSKEEERKRKSINFTALRDANKVLAKQGGVVGIFAQRGRHGSIDNTSSSCLLLAQKNDVPILPVHLSKGVMIIMKPEYIGRTINLLYCQKDTRNIVAKKLMRRILNQVTVS